MRISLNDGNPRKDILRFFFIFFFYALESLSKARVSVAVCSVCRVQPAFKNGTHRMAFL